MKRFDVVLKSDDNFETAALLSPTRKKNIYLG